MRFQLAAVLRLPASVFVLGFRLVAVVPLAHFQRSPVPFLPVNTSTRIPRRERCWTTSCWRSLGTRVISNKDHGLEQLAGPVGQCHIDRRFGGLVIAVRTVQCDTYWLDLTGLTRRNQVLCSRPRQAAQNAAEIRASTTTSAAATTATINLPCEENSYQTRLSFLSQP